MTTDIRVLIADDQTLLRDSFGALIDGTEGLCVAGEAGTGAAAVDLARHTRPHVVMMDVRMPEMDGITATRRICSDPLLTDVKVMILTTFDLDEYVYAALRAGASGFLLKNVSAADLITAIRVIAAGEALLAPSITRRLIGEFARLPPTQPGRPANLPDLTPRERDVLRLVATGLSNHEIAERLHVSLGTVKTHIGRLLAKLQARDRAQLVIAAYQARVVTVDS